VFAGFLGYWPRFAPGNPAHSERSRYAVKILAICPRAPFPPDRGDRIRSYQLLSRLAEGHEIHLACTETGALDRQRREGIEQLASRSFVGRLSPFRRSLHATRSLVGHRPVSLGWFHDAKMDAAIKQWCAQTRFDVALVAHAKMAPYWLREHRRSGLRAVLDLVDVDSQDFAERAAFSRGPRRWLYRRERRVLAGYEEEISRRAGGAVVVSEAEAQLLRSRVEVPVEVVENGVDGGFFARPQITGNSDPRRVVFVGRLDVEANTDAVRWYVHHIHPRVRAHCEQVCFDAVGANPTRDLKALRVRPDLRVTGWVPDVRPYLWRATVAVAPMRIPTGTSNGVLEAMAASVPVVATSAAARGLVRPRGEHVRIAESPAEMAEAVCSILEDPLRARAQVEAALDYVKQFHSWDRAAAKLEERLLRTVRTVEAVE
jgi:sugar transferase (PEP-CTERM/EpsH1 system associated)